MDISGEDGSSACSSSDGDCDEDEHDDDASSSPLRQVTDNDSSSGAGALHHQQDTTSTANTTTNPLHFHPSSSQLHLGQEEIIRKALQQEDEQSKRYASAATAAQKHGADLVQVQRNVKPLSTSYTCTSMSLQIKQVLLDRLEFAIPSGRLFVVDLSRRGLGLGEADLISRLIQQNQQLSVLKLACNDFGDEGASIIAAAFVQQQSNSASAASSISAADMQQRHHPSLSVLDLGFNDIGNDGCSAIALHAIAGNPAIRTLYLSGNYIKTKGVAAIAGAILHGAVGLSCLHLSGNPVGTTGLQILAGAITQSENRRQQIVLQQQHHQHAMAIPTPQPLEELYLNMIGINRHREPSHQNLSLHRRSPQPYAVNGGKKGGGIPTSPGFMALPSMILTNAGMKVLSLSNNNIDDNDMDLLSKAISQNSASMPLMYIDLSFNQLTCVGVESLMNAVWGSQTLRVVKLDSNKIQDRGAQLCSVVLGAVELQMLDLSYNRITTVGIKAIMKSLSENQSMRSFAMAGMAMDQNASKATSYALAYNTTLQALNIDSCSIGYSGQRHIVAGIVSNREVKLRSITGFPLGPITMTLGIPQLPQDWGNDRILSFIRYMWFQYRLHNSMSHFGRSSVKRGPEAPATVAAAAKKAFSALSDSESARMRFEEEHVELESSPVLPPDAAILECARDGSLKVPVWNDGFSNIEEDGQTDGWSETDSCDRSSYTGDSYESEDEEGYDDVQSHPNGTKVAAGMTTNSQQTATTIARTSSSARKLSKHRRNKKSKDNLNDHHQNNDNDDNNHDNDDDEDEDNNTERRSTNLKWLRRHAQSLQDIGSLEFTNADLWQLHQYFFSPAYCGGEKGKSDDDNDSKPSANQHSLQQNEVNDNHKRPLLLKNQQQPAAKRSKNLMPRIDFYPRVREKLESLGTRPSIQTLSLLRKLKYIESTMFSGKDVYNADDTSAAAANETATQTFSDAEMVLLDLL